MIFKVYKVSSKSTQCTYYGYTSEQDVKEEFTKGATRTDTEDHKRGAAHMLNEVNGDIDKLTFDVVSSHEDEIHSYLERNKQRASDRFSVTPATLLPFAARAKSLYPDQVQHWAAMAKAQRAKTARAAYKMGLYSYVEIQKAAHKGDVMKDLDRLTPQEFTLKYFSTSE